MALKLTDIKKERIIKLGESITKRPYITIRELDQFIGNVVATFEAVLKVPETWKQRHHRDMETLKITKLKENNRKFDAKRNLKLKLNGG